MRTTLMTTTAAIACVLPFMAHAQDRTGAQPPVTAGETTQTAPGESPRSSSDISPEAQTAPSTGLGDVIVTAQRRSESAQRAAIAISVVGGADLAAANISQPERLNQLGAQIEL